MSIKSIGVNQSLDFYHIFIRYVWIIPLTIIITVPKEAFKALVFDTVEIVKCFVALKCIYIRYYDFCSKINVTIKITNDFKTIRY